MKPSLTVRYAAYVAALIGVEAALILFADQPVALWARDVKILHPSFFEFARVYTNVGNSAWYLWPCGLVTLLAAFLTRGRMVPERYRRLFGFIGVRTLFIFACVGLSGIAANILKQLVGRPRPLEWLKSGALLPQPFPGHWLWTSMPSGHTTTAFSLLFALSFLAPRFKILWLALALAIAASRVLVNAHYVSDVAAGAALGLSVAWAFHKYGMNRVSKVIFPIDSPQGK